jgi:hypothetical protein
MARSSRADGTFGGGATGAELPLQRHAPDNMNSRAVLERN